MTRHKPTSHRLPRVADQILRDLSEMVTRELRDPRLGLVTLTEVELSPDYAQAKVYFSVLAADPEQTEKLLNARAGYLHSLLFKRLTTHTVPTLRFVFDPTTERADAMNRLLHDALADSASSAAPGDDPAAQPGGQEVADDAPAATQTTTASHTGHA